MIQYEGMKAEENQNVKKMLPAGAYVAKVSGVKIEGTAPDQQLAIVMDISEGPWAGFFLKQFTAAKNRGSQYPIKYKGVLRMRIPNPDNPNAQYPESDLRRFNDAIYRFEKSNSGFRWDGDENKLAGLTVGISVQEDSYNGRPFTKIARLETADEVRQGMVKPMEPKRHDEERPADPTPAPMVDRRSGMQQVDTEELPWDVNI